GLAVDREARGLRGEIDAMALLARGDLDAAMHEALALEPRGHPRRTQDRHRALLDHAGTHAAEHIFAAAPLEDDALDASAIEKLREQEAGRPRADDTHLCSLCAHEAPLAKVERTRSATARRARPGR